VRAESAICFAAGGGDCITTGARFTTGGDGLAGDVAGQ